MIALVVCAAPPALRIRELIDLLMGEGWSVCVTATPTAASWIDLDALAYQTGHPIRVNWRLPGESEPHPTADVAVVAPATFNVMNKWAHGINDTPALGVLNQSLGAGLPVYAFPNVKAELAGHPAYATSIERLSHAGTIIVDLDADLDWRVVTRTVAFA
ncbi:flavoprotein [Micromonospora sp. M71_S20]|uniref:flavoprotein n=1 Tax=Micromonospora sp. M71_S20 TaxID=592872 RepID=UPI000F2830BE|nr:flavoprotein [Micromonospora sp. M71_S20]RLK23347.1 flavoprotein [Micromonospora sp. M71_S20]